ncbi:MAG TPA: TolC family protein [Terriglobales bacterium]
MNQVKWPQIALMAGLLTAGLGAQAPTPAASTVANTAAPARLDAFQRGGWSNFWQRYQPANIAPPDLSNAAALRRQAATGTLYLSLRQVLQLALTSDLDIADASYARLLAQPDYLRTLAGGTARGVAGETISSALFSGAIGASGNGGGGGGGSNAGSAVGGGSGVHGGGGGYDPSFEFTFADEHSRQPLANAVLYGTAEQILNQASGYGSFGQSFTTGTGYSISAGAFRQYQNSEQLFLNPQITSDISIGIQQQFFNGGSRAVNRAGIIMGANSLKYADAYYKAQVTTIVAAAAGQYWALAAAQRQVEIAEQAEQNAQHTYDDTLELVKDGKVPAANRITAQATLLTAHQASLAALTAFQKAGSKLKLFLAKQWSANLITARVVPTDALPSPAASTANAAAATPAAAQLVNRALAFSPQLAEDRVNVSNNDLIVKIRKNTLLPSLTLFASYTSSGVSGRGLQCAVATFPCPAGDLLPSLPGGFGSSVGKVFSYGAPDYGVGFQLHVPVWNRANRADEASAELEANQARVDLQKDQNTVTEQVSEDRIDIEGERAQLAAARQGADLQQQALSDAQDKYRLGKGTITDVLTAEAALTTAQQAVTAAQQACALAQVTLAKDSGTLLDDYHISLGPSTTPTSFGRLK